jgi:hypothetical protein
MTIANNQDLSEIQRIIYTYYQANIPSEQAAYFITPEYFRLRQARAKAEANNQDWLEILAQIRQLSPTYSLRDITNLADNSCYEAELLLHKNLTFSEDYRTMILATGGTTRLVLRLLISVLAPYYHLYIEGLSYDAGSNRYDFRAVISKEHAAIVQQAHQIVQARGYNLLERDILERVMPELSTEYHGAGEASIFRCLFGDLVGLT